MRIEVRFAPMRAGARSLLNPDARISGFGQVIGGFVNSGSRLRKALAGKAKKARTLYRVEGVQYLVVVGVHDVFCTADQFIDGLYGTEVILVDTGTSGRRMDGFFGMDRAHPDGRRRVISGVASLPGYSGGAVDSDVAIFHNPFADVPWPNGLVPAARSWGIVERSENSVQLGWTEPATTESVQFRRASVRGSATGPVVPTFQDRRNSAAMTTDSRDDVGKCGGLTCCSGATHTVEGSND